MSGEACFYEVGKWFFDSSGFDDWCDVECEHNWVWSLLAGFITVGVTVVSYIGIYIKN